MKNFVPNKKVFHLQFFEM